MRRRRGSALVEFSIGWPVFLLAVMACVQVAVWSAETYAARAAALAGAETGAAAGAPAAAAQAAALATLAPFLVGVRAQGWCPGGAGAQPAVWVCGRESGPQVEVLVGGTVPALVPLLPGGRSGLPFGADVTLPREAFVT